MTTTHADVNAVGRRLFLPVFFPALPCSTLAARVTRKVYSSPPVSTPVTVSMFQPQCLRAALLLLRGAFSVSDEETRKQTLAVIRDTLFGPPATCKLLTVDGTVSMCSSRRPRLVVAKGCTGRASGRSGWRVRRHARWLQFPMT